MKFSLFISFTFLFTTCVYSQEHSHEDQKLIEHTGIPIPHHRLTLMTANSFITNSITENDQAALVVPTYGFNYDLWFHQKWGAGIHTDIVLQQYKVESHEDHTEIVRENPVAICGILLYRPHPKWTFLGGYGIEWERNESIPLYRFGLEYGIELRNDWELGFSFEYDHKIKTYSSWMLGVGFSKIIFNKKY